MSAASIVWKLICDVGWHFWMVLCTCILSQTVLTLSSPISAASTVWKLNCDVECHFWMVLGYMHIITDCAYAFQSN